MFFYLTGFIFIDRFKSIHGVNCLKMTVLIEGEAFPIGRLNGNGEGIPESEIENAIESLKSSVVRVCSRSAPHECDFKGDPKSEIGRVIDAWLQDNAVYARAEITDSVASQKIRDGVWKTGWSIFGRFEDKLAGWVKGLNIESISIVDKPAWKNSQWKVVSASAENPEAGNTFRSDSSFFISASQKTGSENIPEENTVEELEKQLKEAKDRIAELEAVSKEAEKVPDLEKQVAELSASVKGFEKTISEKTALIASLEKDKAGTVPTDTVKELIASAILEHDKVIQEKQEWDKAMDTFAAARARLGIETKFEEFKNLAASDLIRLAEDLDSLKTIAAGDNRIRYPAGSGNKSGGTVGRYDPIKKEWVV